MAGHCPICECPDEAHHIDLAARHVQCRECAADHPKVPWILWAWWKLKGDI